MSREVELFSDIRIPIKPLHWWTCETLLMDKCCIAITNWYASLSASLLEIRVCYEGYGSNFGGLWGIMSGEKDCGGLDTCWRLMKIIENNYDPKRSF